MEEAARRPVTVLISRPDGTGVVVDDRGSLPTLTVELTEGETTPVGLRRVLVPWLGTDVVILEMWIEPEAADPAAGPATFVDLVAPSTDWEPPEPLRWESPVHTPAATAVLFGDRVERLLAERRGRLPVHELRSSWSRPDWYPGITAWMDAALVGSGRPRATAVTQVRHWGISAVLRAWSGQDVVWAKAVFPPFRREAAVTAWLHRNVPGGVAPVIATDPEQGWLLLEDVGAVTFADRLDRPGPAIDAITALHHRFAGQVDEVLAAGVADRRLGGLVAAVADVLTDARLAAVHGLDERRVLESLDWLVRAVPAVTALGLPDTLVHGDFHPGNVAATGDGPVIFDWSDAAVATPLVDVVTWQWWCSDDACRDRTWHAFVARWHDLVDPAELTVHRSLCEGVAAAYHVVSYGGILRGLEPWRWPETEGGLREFATRLSTAATA